MNKMENPYTRVPLLRQSKSLRSLFLASFAFIVTLILSSCEYLHEPVRDYFEKWTNKVSIEKYEINNVEFYEDKDGNVCIGSDQDAYVSLFMLNPYHYDFNSPEFSSKITSVQNETVGSSSLSFPDIIPDASDTTHLHLTYAKEFLKAYEGGHDIGAVITVEHPYNSSEKNKYTLNVKCNSKPPVINYGAVMQNNNTYFLCFNIAPSYISDIHTDIKQIVIDDGSNSRTSECHVESDGTIVLDRPDSLSKTSPGTLTAAGPGASFSPDSTNAFYFSSGIAVEIDREMTFTITLIDEAGLSSSTVISTASRQLEAPRAWDSVTHIELVPSTTTSVLNTLVLDSDYNGLISLSIPAQTINGEPVSDVKVRYQLIPGGGTRTGELGDDITVSETGEHQLQVWAEKEGYVNSATVTYTIKIRPLVITFHKNDGTNATATQEVSRGAGVTLKSLSQLGLERTGYTFNGWKEPEDSADEYNNAQENVRFNRDIDLYAYWTPNTYTVTLDYNYSDAPVATTISVTYDSGYTALPSSDPTRTGYRFDGWYTRTTGGTKITDQTTCTTASNHTLYAHWTAKTCVVSFEKNGGSGTADRKTVTFDQRYGDLPQIISKQGYKFIGWYLRENDTSATVSSTIVKTENDHTLYARWEPIKSTVKFKLNGGSGTAPSNIEVNYASTYGNCVTGSWPEDPTRTGYTFNGWWTDSTNGDKITSNTTVQITTTQTLYAHWTKNYYKVNVTYDNCSYLEAGQDFVSGKHGYGSTVSFTVTGLNDKYGLSVATLKRHDTGADISSLLTIGDAGNSTNKTAVTVSFTILAYDVDLDFTCKPAYTVDITVSNVSVGSSGETLKTCAAGETVRLWIVDGSTAYTSSGYYKDVDLDYNSEYHGFICLPDNKTSLTNARVCAMTHSTMGSYGDSGFGCGTVDSNKNASITLEKLHFAVFLKNEGTNSENTHITIAKHEDNSSLGEGFPSSLGFKYQWVEAVEGHPGLKSETSSYSEASWSSSDDGTRVMLQMSVAGIKKLSNNNREIGEARNN